MPTLGATTTAVFASVGLSASDIYTIFTGLIGTGVGFMLWLIQVVWPFLLVLAFLSLMYGIARKYLHIR